MRAFQSQFKVTFTVGWGQSGTRYCYSYSKSSGYEYDSMQCPLKSWYTTVLCESVCEREKGGCVNLFFHYQIHITQPDTYCRGQRPALTLNKWDDLADPLRCTHTHAHTQILLSVISPCTLSKLQKHTSMCILQTHSTFTSVLKHLMFLSLCPLSLITLFLNTLSAIIGRVGCDGEVKPELKA